MWKVNLFITAFVGILCVIQVFRPRPRSFKASEFRDRVARFGFACGFVGSLAEAAWITLFIDSPPFAPEAYWKFLGFSGFGVIAWMCALVLGLFSRGAARLEIILIGLTMLCLSLLTLLLSIRFS